MNKDKKLCFAGQTIFVGLDVHKNSWKVNSRIGNMELAAFSQDSDPRQLKKYFDRNYPHATIRVAYEAGFCGFEIQRSLKASGIECIVVNAADVPSADKDKKRKDDKRDARKLSRSLAEGNLSAIYIPEPLMEHGRSLVRQRHRLIQDQTRCKNRIKHLLLFSGLRLSANQPERWSQRYIKELQGLNCDPSLRQALNLAIEQYLQLRNLLKQATLAIRQLAGQPCFSTIQGLLQGIDGIGLINAMVIQTEIQDIHRFKTLDKLCDYAGFVPDISSSADHTVIKGVTKRRNEFLREAILESSWICIRKDPAMLMKYNGYKKRMHGSKAIIRIAKHLLSRIRYVWKEEKEYQRGIVA